jgi:hypothetical protein
VLDPVCQQNRSKFARESTERVFAALRAPSAIDKMRAKRREQTHRCLGEILMSAIRRAKKCAQRANTIPLKNVSSIAYKRVLRLCAQLTDETSKLQMTSDPPSEYWDVSSLNKLESWAKIGLELLDKPGPRTAIDWDSVAELVIFYQVILKRSPSASDSRNPNSDGTLPAPMMRFVIAAFEEARIHAPAECRGFLTPPSTTSVYQKIIPQLARLENRELPFAGIEIASAKKRVLKIWSQSVAAQGRQQA